MATSASVAHVSPRCVKIVFEYDGTYNTDIMSVDTAFSTLAEYSLPGNTLLAVKAPAAQDQPMNTVYETGGAPKTAYLIFENAVASGTVTINAVGNLRDWYGNQYVGDSGVGTSSSETLSAKTIHDVEAFWTDDGYRTREVFKELGKLGRVKFASQDNQPYAHAMAQMMGKINDIMSGGFVGKLGADIAGMGEPTNVPTFGYGGFSAPSEPLPGIGSTLQFSSNIPLHIDKLWGNCDGSNTTFRASIPYHAFACQIIISAKDNLGIEAGPLSTSEWYAPNEGEDRLLELLTAPPVGASVLAIYVPRQSIVRIGREIIAYHESDVSAATAIINGRSQLRTQLAAHSLGDEIEDVWCTSFLGRVAYQSVAFGASGNSLEKIALDWGCPKSDNPTLTDTELRRMVFHTGVTMRGTFRTVELAIRYMFPRLYLNMHVLEDPRWPGCITIFYNQDQIKSPEDIEPPVEPWEAWLDNIAWPDGFPHDLHSSTYYRDTSDDAPYGDFWLENPSEGGAFTLFPVVIVGTDPSLIGTMLDFIPNPYVNYGTSTVDSSYTRYLQRPESLDKVLPVGCGVLILDYSLL